MSKELMGARKIGGRTAADYTIIITYDGERTEDDYFRGWQLVISPSRLNLDPYYVKSGGNALKAVQKSIAVKKKATNFAEFWCVCDVDDTPATDLSQARLLATANNIKLCLSSRCFEVWLALHYACSTKAILNEKDAINLVKNHYSEYSGKEKSIPFHVLLEKTEDAINNANILSATSHVNPSTNIQHLVRKLLQNTL